jgi:polysaccharide export outer membrane protein
MKLSVRIVALTICACASFYSQAPTYNQTSQSGTQTQTNSSDERYRIGYQDTLDIQVFGHPQLNRRAPVNPDGTISLFRLEQPIVAVCKTETELARDIEKAYEKDYLRNPEVQVVAVDQKSQAVAVIGAVKTPGQYYVNRKVQLLQILAFAGGPDIEHVGSRILIYRPGSSSNCKMTQDITPAAEAQLLDFALKDVQEGKSTLWMQPGDIVSVMDADLVYVYGNVNKQGAVKMREPITLTQAIASAEGLKSATVMDSVRVIRQKPGTAERTETVYNFKEIIKGKSTDPYLQPNDIVAISQDKTQNILNSVGRSLTTGIPSFIYRIP